MSAVPSQPAANLTTTKTEAAAATHQTRARPSETPRSAGTCCCITTGITQTSSALARPVPSARLIERKRALKAQPKLPQPRQRWLRRKQTGGYAPSRQWQQYAELPAPAPVASPEPRSEAKAPEASIYGSKSRCGAAITITRDCGEW